MVDTQTFLDQLNTIMAEGRNTPAPKLPKPKAKTIKLGGGSILGGTVTEGLGKSLPASSAGPSGIRNSSSSMLEKLMNAIRTQESSGNYGAVNRTSGALGGYQIMPSNLFGGGNEWDKAALGRDVSQSEFMKNSAIQDAIAKYKLNEYLKQYGAAGAAVAWYGGPGAVKNMYNRTQQANGYPSLYDYWSSVLARM